MKNQEIKTTGQKNSILLVIGILFFVIGTTSVENYIKYPLLISSLGLLLLLLFRFAKEAMNQINSRKKNL